MLKKDLQIPDLTGCLAVVTGANSGIGFGITKRLASAGAEVIMAVRNHSKGLQALNEIIRKDAGARISLQTIDLASLKSVNDFSGKLLTSGRPIDYLINNAGLMAPHQRHITSEGFELHFVANYLGHFALTAKLVPLLLAARQSHVTMMSSSTIHFASINLNDLQFEKRFSASKAYAQSKLAMLMFAFELNHKSRQYGWGIVSTAAHPGATRTNINKVKPGFFQQLAMKIPGIWQDVEQGCLPALFAATSSQALPGAYYGPGGIFELNGYPKPAKVPTAATNKDDLKCLWTISEQLANVQFPEDTGINKMSR